jgi:hypothetical protein
MARESAMTSARTTPHDASIDWIGIADPASRLEYSIDPSAGTEAIDALHPVVFQR